MRAQALHEWSEGCKKYDIKIDEDFQTVAEKLHQQGAVIRAVALLAKHIEGETTMDARTGVLNEMKRLRECIKPTTVDQVLPPALYTKAMDISRMKIAKKAGA